MSDNAAGWQPDPTGKHDHRYWDGTAWTDNVSDAGVASTDPYEASAEPVAPEAEPAPPAAEEPTVVTPVAAADTTDSWPTTPTPPAAPPPYVPPTPAAGGDGTSGGGKRGLVIGGVILAAVAAAVVAFLLLGGDDDEDDVRAQLATAIQADTDVGSEQAECVADLIVDEAGEDAFSDTDFNAEDPPQEFIEALLAVGMDNVIEECGIDESAFGGTDSGTTDDGGDSGDDGGEETLEDLESACADGDFTACDDLYFSADLGSDLEEFGSTCGGIAEPQSGSCEATNGGQDDASTTDGFSDGNIEEIIADTYEEMFGISREKAECLAGKISGAIEDGSLTEEQAMTEIFDYLEACDISMEEISGN